MDSPPDLNQLDDETRRLLYLRTVEPLWRRGNLRFKLDETQLQILDRLEGVRSRKFFLLCSRRLGKSYMLVCLAFSLAIRQSGARILYLAPWAKDAAEIATDLAAQLLEDCPAELRPKYNAQSKEFVFGNGSVIRFKGVNGEHAQYLRGGATHFVILDECGLMDNLKHVVSDVVMPMTLTTGGRIVFATTPPVTPGHDSSIIFEQLAGEGAVVKFTLLDNHRVSDEVKGEFLKEAGEDPELIPLILAGLAKPRTTTARREYFCEFVTDSLLAVLPEFDDRAQVELVREFVRPPYFDAYVSMDPGMQDRTGILYGFWDFRRGKLVVEDESLLQGPTTLKIADEIVAKEYALWGDKRPLLRVSDVDLRLIADLWERHQISFRKAEKQDSLGAINLVRNMIQTRELELHPRCVHLQRQMKNAIWNNKVTDFARAGQSSPDGHFDLVAALKYLCRHVQRRKNPYPDGWGRPDMTGYFRSPRTQRRDKQLGLLADTPFTRRVVKQRSRRN